MRNTIGKPTLDQKSRGEKDCARVLAAALAHVERNDRHTHGFHTYPAGLHPEAARGLVRALPPGSVLDPFCGGGTVLVEAMLDGRDGFGTDLSETAVLVTRTRTALVDEDGLRSLRSTARKATEKAKRPAENGAFPKAVGDWYDPRTLAELASLRSSIRAAEVSDTVRTLLWGVFSSILIKCSFRVSDTSSRREVRPRPPETTAILFHKKARELAKRLTALREDVEHEVDVSVQRQDATKSEGAVASHLVCSPPYPGVYDYLGNQWLRDAWFERKVKARAEIGARSEFKRATRAEAEAAWAASTQAWMAAVHRRVAPGGQVMVVVGDGLVRGQAVSGKKALQTAAAELGWQHRATASALRPDHARGAGRWEHALWWRIPPVKAPAS